MRSRRPRSRHVVLVGQVAQMLGWSTARVRSIDEILNPMRLADGTRAYDVDRALAFVRHWDAFLLWAEANPPRVYDVTPDGIKPVGLLG